MTYKFEKHYHNELNNSLIHRLFHRLFSSTTQAEKTIVNANMTTRNTNANYQEVRQKNKRRSLATQTDQARFYIQGIQ